MFSWLGHFWGSTLGKIGGLAIKGWMIVTTVTTIAGIVGTSALVIHIQYQESKLIVITISGLNTAMDKCQYTGDTFSLLQNTLGSNGFTNSYTNGCPNSSLPFSGSSDDLAEFSYSSGHFDNAGHWIPKSFTACDVDTQTIDQDSGLLGKMLDVYHSEYPNAHFALVGHSWGGVVALYGASQYIKDSKHAGLIKDVVTIDSPLHGRSLAGGSVGAEAFNQLNDDLVASAVDKHACLTTENMMGQTLLAISNNSGNLAENEVFNLQHGGVKVATVGNLDDCLYQQSLCFSLVDLLQLAQQGVIEAASASLLIATPDEEKGQFVDGATQMQYHLGQNGGPVIGGHGAILKDQSAINDIASFLLPPQTSHVTVTPMNTPIPEGTITEFTIPTTNSHPANIITGPDGNLWFVERSAHKIGRVTTSGQFTEFLLPDTLQPTDITKGPDGNLWFTALGQSSGNSQLNMVGRITPNGQITLFADPASDCCGGWMAITSGPDGNLWIANKKYINQMSTAGAIIAQYAVSSDDNNALATSIIMDSDNNLWFASGGDTISQISISGTIQMFRSSFGRTGQGPIETLTVGPDGNLWFVGALPQIGYMTRSGSFTFFDIPTAKAIAIGITSGPDGNIWYTDDKGNKIAQVTPSGIIREFDIPTPNSTPAGITTGPDGNLWFTESKSGKIGRLSIRTTTQIPSTQIPPQSTKTFDVHADQDWQNTNIALSQGEHVTIQYLSGYWVGSDGVQFDANGPKPYICADAEPASQCVEAVPDFTQNALVGKVGTQILKIGDHLDFVVENAGNLMLRRNNGNCCNSDTTGVITVQIVISSN